MIRKHVRRIVVYGCFALFVAIVGFWFYKNITGEYDKLVNIRDNGIETTATIMQIPGWTYNDDTAAKWSIKLDIETGNTSDGTTYNRYTKAQAEEMDYKIRVKYITDIEDGKTIYFVYEAKYLDTQLYKSDWSPDTAIGMFVFALVFVCFIVYHLVHVIRVLYVLKKGKEVMGKFVTAYHDKSGSRRYYHVKYSYVGDNGEEVEVISPCCYEGPEVDRLETLGVLRIKYLGKRSVIDYKF